MSSPERLNFFVVVLCVGVAGPANAQFGPYFDLADMDALFAQCFGGSDNPPAQGCSPCVDADLDYDGDVDLTDFGLFAGLFTGSNGGCGGEPCQVQNCCDGGGEAMGAGAGASVFSEQSWELYWLLYEYCEENGIPFS